MKRTVIFILVLNFIFVSAQTHPDDRINRESDPLARKGTFYKIPEVNPTFNNAALSSNIIFGGSIHTSWGEIEKSEGVYDWSYLDNLITNYKAAGKKVSFLATTANFSINDSPDYLYSKYNIRRIVAGYWESFESTADKGYILYGTKSSTNPISGGKSLQMSTATPKVMMETGANQIFNRSKGITNPTYNPPNPPYPNRPSPSFCLQFSYRANAATIFSAKAYSKSNPTNAPIETIWTATVGESGTKTFNFSPLTDDYKVEITIKSGNLSIDNINICDMVTGYWIGTLCFPNYFDPIFKEKYELFIKAVAERYKNEETLNEIAVNGYGRWEEITISGDDPNMFEDQWTTYGYSDQKYIEHIKWCIDTYKKHFTTKKLYTGAVGWNTEGWRDQNLIDWKVGTYAAHNGVAIKYNGWQSMCSEWGSVNSGFQYIANRHKYDKNVSVYYEEQAQINNETFSEYMGHPISLFNRLLVDNVDYFWMYDNDLSQTYVNRYQHYANEMAGSALITKLYNQFSRNDYYSPKAMKTFLLKNIWLGLYQKDDYPGTKYTYVTIDGQKAVQTNSSKDRISISIDDRLRYNGMYGAVLTFDYLDQGTDQFKVYGKLPTGLSEIATIKKTNSGTWKTFSSKDTGWAFKSSNSGADDLVEIEIADLRDGVETLKSMEVNYVPANDWQEKVVLFNDTAANKKASLSSIYTYNFSPVNGFPLSSIAVNVSPATTGYVNIEATVTATVFGQNQVVTTKEYYMPYDNDWFIIPIANGMNASSYRLTLKTKTGSAYVNLGANNLPAYRMYSFVTEPGDADVDPKMEEIEALKPFCMLTVADHGNSTLKLKKRVADGTYLDVSDVTVYSSGKAMFEPQPSGIYRLVDANNQPVKAIPTYLKRLSVPRTPMRYQYGTKVFDFKADSAFVAVSGLKKCVVDQLGFHARLTDENPVIISSKPMKLNFSNLHQVHFVMKNETNSSLAKIYWKTDKSDYSEANAMLLPIVPNDDQYREYTYPIGIEPTWKDKIMELKFMPVFGHTDAGKIHIYAFDIRRGTTLATKFDEPLLTADTDFSVFGNLEITNFQLENGSASTEKDTIVVTNEVSGRVPTEFIISEKGDFSDAGWQSYQINFSYSLSANLGQKKVYFKVKDSFSESKAVVASILYENSSGISDPSARRQIKAYPNPVKSFVKFDCTDNESEKFNVTIMSITGIIYSKSVETGNFKLNLSNYAKGIYLIVIENQNGIYQKVIIKE